MMKVEGTKSHIIAHKPLRLQKHDELTIHKVIGIRISLLDLGMKRVRHFNHEILFILCL